MRIANMLPNRVAHCGDDIYLGYGPNAQEIIEMTSSHKPGHEPLGPIHMFERTWVPQEGSYSWKGVVYLRWEPAS